MNTTTLAWYCARTKPKHEHIAAASVRQKLGLEVFYPRLRLERVTQRGVVHVVEALFPCYIFVRCVLARSMNEVQYSVGVSTLVHFSTLIPTVPDEIIEELQRYFEGEEPLSVANPLLPGTEVVLAKGAFAGMRAVVLRTLPARQRVRVLLDVLGRQTPVEVDRRDIALEKNVVTSCIPLLVATHKETPRV